jgi:hypothetical protein
MEYKYRNAVCDKKQNKKQNFHQKPSSQINVICLCWLIIKNY